MRALGHRGKFKTLSFDPGTLGPSLNQSIQGNIFTMETEASHPQSKASYRDHQELGTGCLDSETSAWARVAIKSFIPMSEYSSSVRSGFYTSSYYN